MSSSMPLQVRGCPTSLQSSAKKYSHISHSNNQNKLATFIVLLALVGSLNWQQTLRCGDFFRRFFWPLNNCDMRKLWGTISGLMFLFFFTQASIYWTKNIKRAKSSPLNISFWSLKLSNETKQVLCICVCEIVCCTKSTFLSNRL